MVNIVITHGFQTIHVNFNIPNNKGRRLFESGHVTHVQELKLANGFTIISGQVIRQTSVTLTPWKVTLEVSSVANCIIQYLLLKLIPAKVFLFPKILD